MMFVKNEYMDMHGESNETTKNIDSIKYNSENNTNISPEFVNIKCEIDIENLSSIKKEPHSDDEEYFNIHFASKHSFFPNTQQNTSRQQCSEFSSTIICKQEPSTTSYNNNVKELEITITPVPHINSIDESCVQECQMCQRKIYVTADQAKNQCNVTFDRQEIQIVCSFCIDVTKEPDSTRKCKSNFSTDIIYCCDICKKSYNSKSTIIRHLQIHNVNKPYSCKICNKKFICAGLIKPHMRVHTGEKPFACPICNKMFSYKYNMQRHHEKHNKIKQLKCPVCNKKFPMECRLKYHMRIHTKDKPFKCGVCNKLFSHKQNVLRHYSRKHPLEKYNSPDTDASTARVIWENVINNRVELFPN